MRYLPSELTLEYSKDVFTVKHLFVFEWSRTQRWTDCKRDIYYGGHWYASKGIKFDSISLSSNPKVDSIKFQIDDVDRSITKIILSEDIKDRPVSVYAAPLSKSLQPMGAADLLFYGYCDASLRDIGSKNFSIKAYSDFIKWKRLTPRNITTPTCPWDFKDGPARALDHTGTNPYLCIKNHVASTQTRPTSGASWATYWALIGSVALKKSHEAAAPYDWKAGYDANSYYGGLLFRVEDPYIIPKIGVKAKKVGSPASVNLRLWTVDSDYNLVSNERTVDITADLTTAYQWIEKTITNYTFAIGAWYAITLDCAGISISDYVCFAGEETDETLGAWGKATWKSNKDVYDYTTGMEEISLKIDCDFRLYRNIPDIGTLKEWIAGDWYMVGTCRYNGAETWCDRSFPRCLALNNWFNFRGFRYLPGLIGKKVIWGQATSAYVRAGLAYEQSHKG